MLSVEPLDGSPLPKRRRRRREGPPDPVDTLPAEWKAMAALWVRRGARAASGCRWETLAAEAGPEGYPLATRLLDWLLHAGWIAVIEERRHGGWRPMRVEFSNLAGLRQGLGLPDPEEDARRWEELRASFNPAGRPELTIALEQLAALPPRRAAQRAELLQSLARWADEGRSGTRRDFAQFARGGAKAVTEAEWRWLEEAVDLAAYAIERHTPLLLIAASVALELPMGILDLGAAPDVAALILEKAVAPPRRQEHQDAPRRREKMAHHPMGEPGVSSISLILVNLCALGALVVRFLGLSLPPSRRHAPAAAPSDAGGSSLSALPVRRVLDAADQAILARRAQAALPPTLQMLARWMREHGEKGEQEGLL